MKRFSLSSVRIRLFLLVCMVLVPIAILLVFNIYQQRKHALDSARKSAARIINFAVIQEEEIFRETRQILGMLADIPAVARGGQDCRDLLVSLLENFPQYTNFGVVRPEGDVYCSALPVEKPVNVSDRPYFRDALEKRSFSVGEYQVGRITGKPGINFGYPVLDRNGGVTAVVFAALDLSWVAKAEYEIDVQTPPNSPYVTLDRNGAVLSSYPTSYIFGRGSPLEKPLFEKISREKTGTFEAVGVDGVNRLYLFSTLRGPLHEDGVYVMLGIPTQALFQEVNRQLAWNLAVLAGVVLLVLGAMWIWGRKLIVRPVEILVDASNRLAAGDLTARTGLPVTLGELGSLGGAFDRMAEELEQREIESRRMQEQVSKGLRMLSALREIDLRILGGASVRETLGVLCDAIIDMGYRLCWVGLAEADHTVRVAAVRGVEEGALDRLEIRWDDTPPGSGPSGTVIKTGRPYVSQDILHNERFAPWTDKVIEWGLRSLVSLPLKSRDGKVIGVLHVYSERENGFSPEDIHDLETFARQCNVALNSGRQLDELRDAHQRLSFHVNRMPLAYIVWNQDFHVMEWNPAAERIFGWKTEEALGKHPYELIVPGEAQPHVEKVWSKLLQGDESSTSLNANVRKDGKTITCEWFNTPLRDARDNITGVLSMVHDVTEKTQLERQLQTAQRMEAVGTLAGGIAHDFNNALTGIFGFGEMLKPQMEGNEQALSNLHEIMRCAERAATLTRQLLTYSRRQVIEPVNLSLNTVITDLLKLVSKVLGEHIEIRTFLAKDLPAVRADVGQIEQVVMNLVLNARDAMPDGGQLLLETGVVELEAEYVRYHPYMSVGRYVFLAVSDTGVGMDEKTQERAFEPFFTTKTPDKGTGLGLSMVYGTVKQHNGFIHLYSEPGKGTTFKMYFPPVEGPPDEVLLLMPSEICGGTETILLAEDDESVRMFSERALRDLGYIVLVARNGRDAVEVFHRNKDRISLVLLDVVMPLAGGKEAYEVMRQIEPGLKVIFMSGYTANAVHESFVLHPGAPFLAKPFGPGALARKVRAVLDNTS